MLELQGKIDFLRPGRRMRLQTYEEAKEKPRKGG